MKHLIAAGSLALLLWAPGAQAQQDVVSPGQTDAVVSPDGMRGDDPMVQWHRENMRRLDVHLRGLAASTDARDQLAIAVLTPMVNPDMLTAQEGPDIASLPSFKRAGELGSNDPLVAWMQALNCPADGDPCSSNEALQRLARLQPDNAAPLAMLAAGAHGHGGDTAAYRWLTDAAEAKTFRLPLGDLGQMLYPVLLDANPETLPASIAAEAGFDLGLGRPATPEDLAQVATMAVVAAVALPGFRPLMDLCESANNPSAANTAQRRDTCLALAWTMGEGEDLISRSIGLSLQRMLGSPEMMSEVQDRERQLQWLTETGVKELQASAPDDYLLTVFDQGEVPAIRALLVERGHGESAPADWASTPLEWSPPGQGVENQD